MSTTYETGFSTTLALPLSAAATSMEVATAPTKTSGRLLIKAGTTKEWVSYTGVSGTTVTGLTRGLSQTADPSTAGTGVSWIAGTTVKLVAMHDQLLDKLQGDEGIIASKIYATTAARDTALGADGAATKWYNGIAVTATGLTYDYNLSSAQWESRDTGVATANASTTVAGKVELTTDAELAAGTDTGGTGASLVAVPSQINPNKFTDKTSATGADKILIADSADNNSAKSADLDNVREAIPASTTLKGTVELATDAEATTGTDETRYINAKQAKDNYGSVPAIGNTNRSAGSASGTESIAHGLGVTPSRVTFTYCISNNNSSLNGAFYGVSDGTTDHTIGIISGDNIDMVTSKIISLHVSTNGWTAVCNLDATNIDIVWTKVASGATIDVIWTAEV